MASGSNACGDSGVDDGRGFSGAEVDVELEFIAQGEKTGNLRRQGKRFAGQWEVANQGKWNFEADGRRFASLPQSKRSGDRCRRHQMAADQKWRRISARMGNRVQIVVVPAIARDRVAGERGSFGDPRT